MPGRLDGAEGERRSVDPILALDTWVCLGLFDQHRLCSAKLVEPRDAVVPRVQRAQERGHRRLRDTWMEAIDRLGRELDEARANPCAIICRACDTDATRHRASRRRAYAEDFPAWHVRSSDRERATGQHIRDERVLRGGVGPTLAADQVQRMHAKERHQLSRQLREGHSRGVHDVAVPLVVADAVPGPPGDKRTADIEAVAAPYVLRGIGDRISQSAGRADRIVVSINAPIDFTEDATAATKDPGNLAAVVGRQFDWKG